MAAWPKVDRNPDSGQRGGRDVAFTPQCRVNMRATDRSRTVANQPEIPENRPFRYVSLIQLDEERTRLSIFRSLLRLSG